ncbi:MarR family winged helix-turn-helix transcriptional regulator [Amycolatopsis sp. GM8]|uniref:MarR family winged helix-turn-helix transcriptional regulator n=1 Tax=Amycolatopsis sp. GM8 TaxID=2896530 RepID=UPI001F006AE0|nr:MarR family transcriptional regulator [Amycolatopsis sp. GM8]
MYDADMDLAHVVREAVGRLNWRMRAERDSGGPSALELQVLSRLYRAGTQTPKSVSDGEKIQPQSLTRVLATLEREGLVARRPDPEDGRRSLLNITDGGLATLRAYSVQREEWLADAMARTLSETELELLRIAATIMSRLADS